MKAVLLVKETTWHWALFPLVMERIRKFCADYESVADPELLVQQATNHFAVGNPKVIVLALVCEDGLVGHVLAEISEWAGSNWATVLQYQMDRAMPEKDRQEGFKAIEQWAAQMKADGIQVFARNAIVGRAFRRYGLKDNAVLMRKPVPRPSAVASGSETGTVKSGNSDQDGGRCVA